MHSSIKTKITIKIIGIAAVTFLLSLFFVWVVYVPTLREEATQTILQANEEIAQQIDSVQTFVEDYTENLALSVEQNVDIMRYFSDPNEQVKQIAALKLYNLISYEGLVRCVVIETQGISPLDSLLKITDTDRAVLKTTWYQELQDHTFGRGVSGVYTVQLNGTEYYTGVYLKNFYNNDRRFTYTVFFNLNDLLYDSNILGAKLDYFALKDRSGTIFYTGGDPQWEEVVSQQEHSSGEYGICVTKTALHSQWEIVSFVSHKTIFQELTQYIWGIIALLLLFSALIILFMWRALQSIIQPVVDLAQTMKQATAENLHCKVEVKGTDEIAQLGGAFNKMMEDLEHSISLIAEKERQQQKTKFSLLISQINPHFIYNTINSINYLARKERCQDVITVNSALISILRDRLRINDIDIFDTVSNEVHVLQQYLLIEKYMYDGDLKVVWEIPAEAMQLEIPKNIMQPIIENALFHGLINEETGEIAGTLTIAAQLEENTLVLSIQDDGRGMDQETCQKLQSAVYNPKERGTHIGISNIRERLELLYGEASCMEIESVCDLGTTVRLRIPVRQNIE